MAINAPNLPIRKALLPARLSATVIAPSGDVQAESVTGRRVRRFLACVGVLAAITLWKFDVVELPPYEDQSGLWAEASYLAESGFDYYGLRFEQHAYTDDIRGPRSYFMSLVPAAVALLMIGSSSPRMAIVIAHVTTFACASGVLLLAFDLSRRFQPAATSVLFCLALATTPCFSTQIDMVGMDIPMTLFALLAARAVVDDRLAAALGWATLTFFTKASGGVITGAIVGYLGLRVLLEWGLADRAVAWRHRRALLLSVMVFLAQYTLVNLVDDTLPALYSLQWPTLLRLPGAMYWCPDVVVVVAVTATAGIAATIRGLASTWSRTRFGPERWAEFRRALLDGFRPNGPAVFSAILFAGVLWTVSWVIFVPRYLTIGLPFLYVALAAFMKQVAMPRAVLVAVLVSLTTFNLLNSSGRFYPDVAKVADALFRENPYLEARSCAFRERSREYLAIHQSDMIALGELSRCHAGEPLFITLPFLWQANDPQLGMVVRPIRCFDTHDYSRTISNYREQCRLATVGRTPILAWNREGRLTVPVPRDGDVKLVVNPGPDPLPIYRSAAMEQLVGRPRWEIEERYLDESWDARWPVLRTGARLMFLVSSGRLDRAVREIEAARELQADPTALADAFDAVRRMTQQGIVGQRRVALLETQLPVVAQADVHLAEGLATLLELPRTDDPNDPLVDVSQSRFRLTRPKELSLFSQGVWKLLHHDVDGARADFLATDQDGVPSELSPVLHYAVAVIDSKRGDVDAALNHVRKALSSKPAFSEALALLGELLAQQGQWAHAERYLAMATALAPKAVRLRNLWGVALARLGRESEADTQFLEAIRLCPQENAAARRNQQALRNAH
ncbi:MAG: tetratricopeptide repeat protein [Pirellulales bacterium]|nr:tetratricopeptide repeat protein [Pirellulales bacterium]